MITPPPTLTADPIQYRRALPAWIQVVVLLVIFGSGVGVGGAAASRYMLSRMQHYRAHPEVLPGEITDTLTSRLGLTDQQSAEVLTVITQRHTRIEEIRRNSAPGIHAEFDLLEKEVAAVLNSKQKPRWLETADWVRKSFLPLNPNTNR